MKTHATQIRVEAEHLDKGDHANWLAQLAIAEQVLDAFRKTLGIGLDVLKDDHDLFLVMRTVKDVSYRRQLRLGDVIDVRLTMWVASLTRLEFHCLFSKGGEVATEMSWVMPLVSAKDECPCRIPPWMIEIIGTEKPEFLQLRTA